MRRALDRARDGFGRSYPLLIGGGRVDDRELADIRYPADPSIVVGRVAQATLADVEAAVAAASVAFPDWRDLPPQERTEILLRAADIMEERRFELAAMMVFESAKPWHEADGDVIEAIDYLRYYALQGEQLATPRKIGDVPGERNEYFHEGRGVTAVIAPWNFPLAIICGMTVASLAGGNCAILKPAAQSPVIAFKLVELLREAGVPDGAVQYLPGPGSRIGQALVEHPGVANIAFTGSKEVGLGIIQSAARASATSVAQGPGPEPVEAGASTHVNIGPEPVEAGASTHVNIGKALPLRPAVKRVVAEMGGKNAIIIDDDADLDQAISAAVISAFDTRARSAAPAAA